MKVNTIMRIFVENAKYFNRCVTDDKKYLFNCLKHLLAPWRVLGIDKCGALTRAAAKHTPRKGNKNNTENQTASAAARSRPR